MLSALYPDIDWQQIRCVGFDLDGTLYDEYAFIDQAYAAILAATEGMLTDAAAAGDWMRDRWLVKGSSYTHIFGETFERFGAATASRDDYVQRALQVFRDFNPQLTLPARNRRLLDKLCDHYRLFLISDGNPQLQQRKFDALGLTPYFAPQDRVFTGAFGPDWHKPSVRSLERLSLDCEPGQGVFFGDRDIDRTFARAAHMAFVPVYNLIGSNNE